MCCAVLCFALLRCGGGAEPEAFSPCSENRRNTVPLLGSAASSPRGPTGQTSLLTQSKVGQATGGGGGGLKVHTTHTTAKSVAFCLCLAASSEEEEVEEEEEPVSCYLTCSRTW